MKPLDPSWVHPGWLPYLPKAVALDLAAWNEATGGKRHREGLRTIGDAIGAARRQGGSALP